MELRAQKINTMGIFDFFRKKEPRSTSSAKCGSQSPNYSGCEDQSGTNSKDEVQQKPESEFGSSCLVDLSSFFFESWSHQRYEPNGRQNIPLQKNVGRGIKIEDNVNGDIGCYTMTIFNLSDEHPMWGGNIQISPKPMKIVEQTDNKICLRGYGYDVKAVAMGIPMKDASFADYGMDLYHFRGKVTMCVLHRFDRDFYIEYYCGTDGKQTDPRIETQPLEPKPSTLEGTLVRTKVDSTKQQQSTNDSVSSYLSDLAMQANFSHNSGNSYTPHLFIKLYDACAGDRGHLLLNIDSKNCMSVGLAFAYMAISMNWHDEDYNSVAAENAYYCLAKNLSEEKNSFVAPTLFTLLLNYSRLLEDKLDATHRTFERLFGEGPTTITYAGLPFYCIPNQTDIHNQAVSYRIAIMNHLITFFYDTNTDSFTIPTDLPYLLPSKSDIQKFQQLLTTASDAHVDLDKGGAYFHLMFKECEQTLNKCR